MAARLVEVEVVVVVVAVIIIIISLGVVVFVSSDLLLTTFSKAKWDDIEEEDEGGDEGDEGKIKSEGAEKLNEALGGSTMELCPRREEASSEHEKPGTSFNKDKPNLDRLRSWLMVLRHLLVIQPDCQYSEDNKNSK